MGKPAEGACHQIQGKQVEQQDKPPGMVHIEETEFTVQLEFSLGYGLKILHRRRSPLGDNRTDNRNHSQADQKKDSELQ
jgi:hypothetical protein